MRALVTAYQRLRSTPEHRDTHFYHLIRLAIAESNQSLTAAMGGRSSK